MSREIDLEVLERIYDVPLGRCSWDDVTARLQRLARAEAVVLLRFDGCGRQVRKLSLRGVDGASWRRYEAEYAGINPFMVAIRAGRVPEGTLVSDCRILSRRAFERTEYYNGFWRPEGFRHTAGAYVRDEAGFWYLLGLPRRADAGPYADTDLARLQTCFNHVRRALRLEQVLDGRREDPDLDALARRYGLTPAEVKVVEALTVTGSLRKAAQRLNRSYNTLRAHLRTILGKTGTRSQVELMTLIHAH